MIDVRMKIFYFMI